MNDDDEVVEIYRAQNIQQAYLLRGLLADSDIEATVAGDQEGASIPPGFDTEPTIYVRASDRERALAMLGEFERRNYQHFLQDEAAASERTSTETDESTPVGRLISKPPCSACGGAVQGTCSYCNAVSAEFLLDESAKPTAEGEETPTLTCPICQEPTTPHWECSVCHLPV